MSEEEGAASGRVHPIHPPRLRAAVQRGQTAPRGATPSWTRTERKGYEEAAGLKEEVPTAVPDSIPRLSKFADELLGKFSWVGRGSRVDVAEAVNKLAARVS